jgi:hypothetical protein
VLQLLFFSVLLVLVTKNSVPFKSTPRRPGRHSSPSQVLVSKNSVTVFFRMHFMYFIKPNLVGIRGACSVAMWQFVGCIE